MGNHVNSCPEATVPHLCSVSQNCLCLQNSSIPDGLHTHKQCSTSASSSSPGRILTGTSLFLLLKSPDHLLCSQVLNGVTRPIPQLGFPISKRNLSFFIPFLVYWDQLRCDCSVRVHVWFSGVLSCRILGLLKEQVSGSSQEASPAVPLGFGPAYRWLHLGWLSLLFSLQF